MKSLEQVAREAVEAAGAAGGSDEVERLALYGWPIKRPLDTQGHDEAALILEIRREADRIRYGW
jgi:hypothetical protein